MPHYHCSLEIQLIMNTQLMISALRQGKTGNQILAILDAITSGGDVDASIVEVSDTQTVEDAGFVYMPTIAQNVPTMEEIVF